MSHTVKEYFPTVSKLEYIGDADVGKNVDKVAFVEYNADEVILGRKMREWCRFSVCYWHTFCSVGTDPFGGATFSDRPWMKNSSSTNYDDVLEAAKSKADAAFEFFTKLGVDFYTFHDRDIVNEGLDLKESSRLLDEISDYLLSLQQKTGVKLLWGTANLFSHPRFMNGAGTNPDVHVFAYAVAQIKKAMDVTHKLGGENYVFWGGREGFQTILNTKIKRELDHMAALFRMAVDYKHKIGANFQLLIEPKPREPTKHQYDYDASTVLAFLHTYGLEKHFKLNVEPNHTTLAGHDYEFDIFFAAEFGALGSIDCNTGDPLLGWDTDQFLMDDRKSTLVMKKIVDMGGLSPGGLNFDAKVRRESTTLDDLFIAHAGSMDCFAKGLRKAAKIIENKKLSEMVDERYKSWDGAIGVEIEQGNMTFEELENLAISHGEPIQTSGHQELYELVFNRSCQ